MPMSEFAIWAGVELLICGYTLNKIEAAKAAKAEADKAND